MSPLYKILQKDRRNLHRIPETDRDVFETIHYIESVLSCLRCELTHPIKESVAAFFDAGKKDTFAFRAELDALPVTEKTGVDYRSTHPGKMHACGHDGHMAMLLAFARYIDKNLRTLKHNVLLIFQPAEETTGGAKDICESGVFERYHTRAIFAIHVWPDLKEGIIASKEGPMMARSSQIDVRITGKSVHIAKHEQGADALASAVYFLDQCYKLDVENENPNHEHLLKFGCMNSGSANNAISDLSVFKGSLRAFDEESFDLIRDKIHQIQKDTENRFHTPVQISMSDGYPAVNNDAVLYRRVKDLLGDTLHEIDAPARITEDFSYYQKHLPGLFFFLGVGGGEALHSPKFIFDEKALVQGVRLYIKLLNID